MSPIVRRSAHLLLSSLVLSLPACGSDDNNAGRNQDDQTSDQPDGGDRTDGDGDNGDGDNGDGDSGDGDSGDGDSGDGDSGDGDSGDGDNNTWQALAVTNHSFEAYPLAPNTGAENWDGPTKPKAVAVAVEEIFPGHGFGMSSLGSGLVYLAHPGSSQLDDVTPLAAPGDGNNAVMLYSGSATGETFVWSHSLGALSFQDEYRVRIAVAVPKNLSAPGQVSLVVAVSSPGEAGAPATLTRTQVTLGAAHTFEDLDTSFVVSRDLHGKLLHVGLHTLGAAQTGLLMDNVRVERLASGAAAPDVQLGVLNGSFEQPAIAVDSYTQDALHWKLDKGGDYAGIARHTEAALSEVEPLPAPAAGNQALELSRGATALSSVVAHVSAGTYYRASVAVAARKGVAASQAVIRFKVADNAIAVEGVPTEPVSVWQTRQVCYAAQASDLGEPLHIQLEAVGQAGRVMFDNVTFEASGNPCTIGPIVAEPIKLKSAR